MKETKTKSVIFPYVRRGHLAETAYQDEEFGGYSSSEKNLAIISSYMFKYIFEGKYERAIEIF